MTETLVVYGLALACIALVTWALTRSERRQGIIPHPITCWRRLKARIERWLGDDPKNPRGYD